MNYAFKECYKASGLIKIEAANPTIYTEMFYKAARDSDGIIITGPCPTLAEIAATNTEGKVTVLE